jgi:hypothetical protein
MGNFCPPGCGYGSSNLIQSGSNPDLDPKHWFLEQFMFLLLLNLELIPVYTANASV